MCVLRRAVYDLHGTDWKESILFFSLSEPYNGDSHRFDDSRFSPLSIGHLYSITAYHFCQHLFSIFFKNFFLPIICEKKTVQSAGYTCEITFYFKYYYMKYVFPIVKYRFYYISYCFYITRSQLKPPYRGRG